MYRSLTDRLQLFQHYCFHYPLYKHFHHYQVFFLRQLRTIEKYLKTGIVVVYKFNFEISIRILKAEFNAFIIFFVVIGFLQQIRTMFSQVDMKVYFSISWPVNLFFLGTKLFGEELRLFDSVELIGSLWSLSSS